MRQHIVLVESSDSVYGLVSRNLGILGITMNIIQLGIVTTLAIITYFTLKPHFEPRIEEIRDRLDEWEEHREEATFKKLEKDLQRMTEQEKIVDAKQATQTQQDRVNEKKRRLNTHDKSLIVKIREEWDKN